jgi:hypothetical protein
MGPTQPDFPTLNHENTGSKFRRRLSPQGTNKTPALQSHGRWPAFISPVASSLRWPIHCVARIPRFRGANRSTCRHLLEMSKELECSNNSMLVQGNSGGHPLGFCEVTGRGVPRPPIMSRMADYTPEPMSRIVTPDN